MVSTRRYWPTGPPDAEKHTRSAVAMKYDR